MLKTNEPTNDIALMRYGDAQYTVLRQGRFVKCAVSGALIPLENLRYWSVDLQEAYRSAEEATKRWLEVNGR